MRKWTKSVQFFNRVPQEPIPKMIQILFLLSFLLTVCLSQDNQYAQPELSLSAIDPSLIQYLPEIAAELNAEGIDISESIGYPDLSGIFFNGLIIITLLLLVSNLLNIALFPQATEVNITKK